MEEPRCTRGRARETHGSIARRLRHSPAPWHVKLATNLGYRFYARNLQRFYNCDWMVDMTRLESEPIVPLTAAGRIVT